MAIVGTSWSYEEELQLCKSWVATKYTDHDNKNCWSNIYAHYVQNWEGDPADVRTMEAVRSRWRNLKKNLVSWHNALKKVTDHPTNDTNMMDLDEIYKAQMHYSRDHKGKTFTHFHCWEVVKGTGIFKDAPREITKSSDHSPIESTTKLDVEKDEVITPGLFHKRPIGEKAQEKDEMVGKNERYVKAFETSALSIQSYSANLVEPAPKMGNSGTSWSSEEELQLCKSWVAVTAGGAKYMSSCQNVSDHDNRQIWRNIYSHYVQNWEGDAADARTIQALQSHWRDLKKNLVSWHNAVKKVSDHPTDDTNMMDEIDLAQRHYIRDNKGKNFTNFHCWEVVKGTGVFKDPQRGITKSSDHSPGTNWSSEEELQLCKSWVAVTTCDPTYICSLRNISDHDNRQLWCNIHAHYVQNWEGSPADIQTANALQSHWRDLKNNLVSWHNAVKKVADHPVDDTNMDRIYQAQMHYSRDNKGKPFSNFRCWDVVKGTGQFKDALREITQPSDHSPIESTTNLDVEEDEDITPGLFDERIIREKAREKDEMVGKNERYVKALETIALNLEASTKATLIRTEENTKRIAWEQQLETKKLQLELQKEENRVMAMDTSTMSPNSRGWWKKRKQAILDKDQECGASGNSNDWFR